ncbi:TetR family transcriptional regulator [Lentzea sp. NBRC 105346]|uniref:TetR/AcrR family transcriptional regulator C-terminal domain-containing protein n=1 Tax=Lentzea sp. NBRC 105346 TaxID=3032205 RepID=UPI0024A17FF2|nr:TetR/AcrR family transcriptional regulator C-terminal domain-containing protein [Lentzea sp. NBRC 105346]GLZ28284.1 TetR family transcriptional regulator [Lentzea sp. NBRC 105346]
MVERSGGGDPARTVELLWRTRPVAGRGRKPKVTVDQIITAAVAAADADGLGAMSMARVAADLGLGTMSLYTHVPGKAELIDLMVDAVLRERDLRPADGDWRAQVELYARRTREVYRRHPWLRDVSMVRPPLGPGLLAGEEFLLAALSGIGLEPRQVVAAMGAIMTFVDGAVAAEVDTAQLERATGESTDAWWAARQLFWDEYFDVTRYPAMTSVWERGGFDLSTGEQSENAFEFGLRRLLDGIEGGVR